MRKVKQYIENHGLITNSKPVLVALSGGADSVALVHILHNLGYALIAAHCNFHLRGEESNRDEAFVKQFCADLSIPLHIKHFETKQYAQEHGISIEMAARDLRYAWFEELRQAFDCQAIAVAHHQNDQAETILLNILRGTGTRGLEGMKAKRDYIIRPLLCMTRTDIENYCKLHHLDHVTDSTNADTAIQRNAIRAALSQCTKKQIQHFCDLSVRMQHYNALLDIFLTEVRQNAVASLPDGSVRISLDDISHAKTQGRDDRQRTAVLLYELVREYGFNDIQGLQNIIISKSGTRLESPTHTLLNDHGKLLIYKKNHSEQSTPQIKYTIRQVKTPIIYTKPDAWQALFDAKILDQPLSLRHWKEGDRFRPLGMKGYKKLQDFFTDIKLSTEEKKRVWLLCSGNEIAWVIGYRISDTFKLTPTSQNIIEVKIQ